MPPAFVSALLSQISALSAVRRDAAENQETFRSIRSQWQNPNDVLTVLMLIGGDIVQRAVAQFAGVYTGIRLTPVAFSFGWVTYSFSAIMSAIGDHRLTPQPDFDCKLINAKSRQERDNKSWVLGRLVRDWDPDPRNSTSWLTLNPHVHLARIRSHRPRRGGLTIRFYDVRSDGAFGVGEWDWVFYMSTIVLVLQLAIACIPGVLHGDWVVLVLTAGGTLLVQLHCALPQWEMEKWGVRELEKKYAVVCLTQGNGSPYVLVIRSPRGVGLRLEDMAGKADEDMPVTAYATVLLAFLWVVHLITTQGLPSDGWYSIAVGALGMVQNVIAAGARRSPSAMGIPLRYVTDIREEKVFDTLTKAESHIPGVGLALLRTFFPGDLRANETAWKVKAESDLEKRRTDWEEATES